MITMKQKKNLNFILWNFYIGRKKMKKNSTTIKTFKIFKKSIYYELAKVCLAEKRISRFLLFFKKISIVHKT